MNVDFVTAIKMYLANYANFHGRSTRAEFWWAMLFVFIVGCVAKFLGQWVSGIVTLALIIPNLAILVRRFHDIGKSGWWVLGIWVLEIIGCCFIFGALGTAILHASESNPEELINSISSNWGTLSIGYIIVFAGAIWQLVWCCKASGPDNRYGINPYGEIPSIKE